MELNPGFTGATLDRADALRANDEKLAAARADPRARLLGLNGLEPLTGGDGRLFWRPMHEAAAGNELVLLGLDGGEPRFAELRLEEADSVNRSMAVMQAWAFVPPQLAATRICSTAAFCCAPSAWLAAASALVIASWDGFTLPFNSGIRRSVSAMRWSIFAGFEVRLPISAFEAKS